VVLGMAGRDRLVIAEGRAAQLDTGHVSATRRRRPA
jgi:hypothetical protein